jgi:hypothetical protein
LGLQPSVESPSVPSSSSENTRTSTTAPPHGGRRRVTGRSSQEGHCVVDAWQDDAWDGDVARDTRDDGSDTELLHDATGSSGITRSRARRSQERPPSLMSNRGSRSQVECFVGQLTLRRVCSGPVKSFAFQLLFDVCCFSGPTVK